jgi:aryl-alcohol dehydrogenase
MRINAAVVREPGTRFVVEELELAEPGPGEVLVDVAAVGLCHTDLSVAQQFLPVPLPAVLGHEGAGVVSAVGAGVTTVTVGDPVCLSFASCGQCRLCVGGHPAYCMEFMPLNLAGCRPDGTKTVRDSHDTELNASFFGQSSFATKALAHQSNTVKLPVGADLTVAAPLGCGVQTGAGSVFNVLKPEPDSSFVVFGAGAVGLAALMAAKIASCTTVIAVDINDERLAVAKDLGATAVINGSKVDDVIGEILKHTDIGADYTIDTTGSADVTAQAVYALAPQGSCAIVGFGPPGTALSVDTTTLMMKGNKVVGVTEGDADPHTFIPRLYDLYSRGVLPLDRLISTYPLTEINTAAADVAKGSAVKAVLLP